MRRLALARTRPARASDPIEPLTTREREILELIDEGLSNKQIAQRLRIELPTVKNHVHNILAKLGFSGGPKPPRSRGRPCPTSAESTEGSDPGIQVS